MKTVLLTVLLLSIQVFAKHGIEGGMSGGGGYVINPESPVKYIDPEHVEDMIEEYGTPSLNNYLQDKNQKLQNGQVLGHEIAALQKIFSSEKNIFKTLKETKIIVEEEKSCFGKDGEPTDGSFFNSKKKAICISAKNIAEKVHHTELKPQALALMAHEYAEVMGLSEDEAVQVQKIVLDDLKQLGTTPGYGYSK